MSWSARHHAWLIHRRIGVFSPPARRGVLQRSIRQQLAIPVGSVLPLSEARAAHETMAGVGLICGVRSFLPSTANINSSRVAQWVRWAACS